MQNSAPNNKKQQQRQAYRHLNVKKKRKREKKNEHKRLNKVVINAKCKENGNKIPF